MVYSKERRGMKKVAVVTGASAGIGEATVKRLSVGVNGIHVVYREANFL
jgi:NADP-dependent 3-hydroxy acid dehydrogenase YdfG